MKCIFLIILSLLQLLEVVGQIEPASLSIGEKIPDAQFKYAFNQSLSAGRINDFKGKLIILDFWSVTCSGCIAAFPKLQRLQKQFGKQVQIILVTSDKKESVSRFLKNERLFTYTRDLKLPIITDDSLFVRYFPSNRLPHEVWIDNQGYVKAITSGEFIKEKYIEEMLSGKPINWPVKKDEFNFDRSVPLVRFVNSAGNNHPTPLYYSGFSSPIKGMGHLSGYQTDSVSRTTRFYCINSPILHIYVSATGSALPLKEQTRILEVADTGSFVYDALSGLSKEEWRSKHYYCYEAQLPLGSTREDFQQKLTKDLEDFFGLSGSIQNRGGKEVFILKDKTKL